MCCVFLVLEFVCQQDADYIITDHAAVVFTGYI